MEQYFMAKRLDFKNLRLCLDNYVVDSLYIRVIGSKGGEVRVNEELEGRLLDFKKDESGLYFLVDSKEVIHFELDGYNKKDTKGFSVTYMRYKEANNGVENLIFSSRGIDPYETKLPEPKNSILRHVLDDCFVEMCFRGRIDLKFHSWWQEPHFKYWTVDESKIKEVKNV